MSSNDTSTIANGSNSSPPSITLSSETWTRDDRPTKIWTDQPGNRWFYSIIENKITANSYGSNFERWQILIEDAGTDCLYMFGIEEPSDGENSAKKYKFVRSNSNEDGLKLSSAKYSPAGATVNLDDPRILHYKSSPKSNNAKIFRHLATKKYVSFTTSEHLVLQTQEDNAHKCGVDS